MGICRCWVCCVLCGRDGVCSGAGAWSWIKPVVFRVNRKWRSRNVSPPHPLPFPSSRHLCSLTLCSFISPRAQGHRHWQVTLTVHCTTLQSLHNSVSFPSLLFHANVILIYFSNCSNNSHLACLSITNRKSTMVGFICLFYLAVYYSETHWNTNKEFFVETREIIYCIMNGFIMWLKVQRPSRRCLHTNAKYEQIQPGLWDKYCI